jgi:hypothetical protein
MGKELKSCSKYTFSPGWLHEPRQKATLLSRFVTRPGTKEGKFSLLTLPREITL